MDKTNKTKDTRNDLANNSSTQTLPLLKTLNHIGKNISKNNYCFPAYDKKNRLQLLRYKY